MIPHIYHTYYPYATKNYTASYLHRLWQQQFIVFRQRIFTLRIFPPLIYNFTNVRVWILFLQVQLYQPDYWGVVMRYPHPLRHTYLNIFSAFILNNTTLLFKLCYIFLITGNPKSIRRRWRKLIYFIANCWDEIAELSPINGFGIYISGNISGRPGKRKKMIRFRIGKKSFKQFFRFADTKQFHIALPTNLINIGFKIIE